MKLYQILPIWVQIPIGGGGAAAAIIAMIPIPGCGCPPIAAMPGVIPGGLPGIPIPFGFSVIVMLTPIPTEIYIE